MQMHLSSTTSLPQGRAAPASLADLRIPTATAARLTPRHRMLGGDSLHGASPSAAGHAGRRALRIFSIAFVLVAAFCALCPAKAYAAFEIHFSNGGVAYLGADGSLTGKAYVHDWDDDSGVHYPVTMPDGKTIYGWCIDDTHAAPAPGNYDFIATPAGGNSYSVVVHSNAGAASGRQPGPIDWYALPPQRIGQMSWSPELQGRLSITKRSSISNITDQNACYSLAGARYGVWKDAACTQGTGAQYDLTTNEQGISNVVTLPPGVYWLKEADAPRGYALDPSAHRVEVSGGQTTTVTLDETPIYESPDVWATKRDIEYSAAQGSATFEGAEFTVRYYDTQDQANLPNSPTRTWILTCDANGELVPSNKSMVRGGEFYRNADGKIVLPLGTVTVQETKAPKGYWLEGQGPESPADYKAPVHVARVNGSGSFGSIVAEEQVKRAGISLQKVDSQTGKTPQGDASLEGIQFEIVNANSQAVVVDGVSYGPGKTVGAPLSTNAQGAASTPADYLPLGTYEVRECDTNSSMLITANPQTVTLEQNRMYTVVPLAAPMSNEVVRGGIRVGKISRELNDHLTQGEATLEGAIFSITLKSGNPVVVRGKTIGQGEEVLTISTNEDGIAQTENRDLPYGTYEIREQTPPKGFLLNEEWSKEVSIREDDAMVDVSSTSDSVDDQVIRGGFMFNKVDGKTMERMRNVAWLVTSNTTGEAHVMVSDENGVVDTEAAPHDRNTNKNDQAFSNNVVDPKKLDPEAGVWFSGRNDRNTQPNNDLKALPYDVYTVRELSSEANKDHDLVSFTVGIHQHNKVVDVGTVDNTPTRKINPKIGTTLTYDGTLHVAPAGEVSLMDTIAYEDLTPGTEYVVKGELHEVGESEGSDPLAVAEGSFTADASNGTTTVVFNLDASNLVGKSVVAYEYVYVSGQDTPVAYHRETNDANQTVCFPSLGTSLTNSDGSKEIAFAERVKLVDTVAYKNLEPNRRYVVTGTLMDKQTEEPLQDESGANVCGRTSFIASEPTGSVQVTFEFAGNLAQGRTLVAFETLSCNGCDLVSHADLQDEGQTVRMPGLRTELADADGNHVVYATEKIELKDTVAYSGLQPGATYVVQGTLMDKATQKPLTSKDGNEIQASSTFVAQESEGTAVVTFSFDASIALGKELVAFEKLYRDGVELAVHANLDDEAQTVRVPHIHTTLSNKTGTHEAAGAKAKIIDAVEYKGLIPGQTYTLIGTLMDSETGKGVIANDAPLSSSTTFVPHSSEGVQNVEFEADLSAYAGKRLVAFENLLEGEGEDGRKIASHEDLNSEEQSVTVPTLRTTATNANTSGKSIPATGKVRIVDEVQYKGLTPSKTYVITGQLYDKDSGRPITTRDGSTVTSSTTIKPESPDGKAQVEFEFDALLAKGGGVVVFETCLHEGHMIAEHANINDEAQTVTVDRQATEEPENKTERNATRTPGTGDNGSMALLAAGLAVLGGSLLIARRLL